MIAAAANLAWLASQVPAQRRYCRQLRSPAETQARVLRELLHRNASSAFGRHHGFAGIRTSAEYAARVPLATYDDFEPWIERIKRGEDAVLTTDPVTHLIPTSGSSGARKLIPFTAQLQREFDAAIGPWISDLYIQNPRALLGPSYWSISPAVGNTVTEESAVPIGFDDDMNYLGGVRRRIVGATMAVPSALRDVSDMETFFLLTLVCLLRRRDLRLISVWHPSFLLLLLEALPRHWESAIEILRTGQLPRHIDVPPSVVTGLHLQAESRRAQELQRIGPHQSDRLWPHLAVISCWTDANAALGSAILSARFPGVNLQSKGLLATEAFVTLPFAGAQPVAIGSHYFEFIDEAGALHPVDALQTGSVYEVVVTTGGGLWRYRLGDRVRVEGFVSRTPSLRFVGRAGEFSDLFGEKLSGEFVGQIIGQLDRTEPPSTRFAMLAPDLDQTTGSYTLFWEGDSQPSARALDDLLSENPHYAWCRQLGQLRPARIFVIRANALACYYRRASTEQKTGDIKPPFLARTTGWTQFFDGHFLE